MRRCLTIVRGLAVIGCASLAACQTFSPDGGCRCRRRLPERISTRTLWRSARRRGRGRARGGRAPAQGDADRRNRRADRAAEQSRPAGRLQRARLAEAADGGGSPAAKSAHLLYAHRRRGELEIERRSSPTFSRWPRCRRAPTSRRALPPGPVRRRAGNAAPRGRDAPALLSRGRGAGTGRLPGAGATTPPRR